MQVARSGSGNRGIDDRAGRWPVGKRHRRKVLCVAAAILFDQDAARPPDFALQKIPQPALTLKAQTSG
ncbi:MAG: hypothetical protein M3N38_03325, partial [Pseudomonadota bacterium]|nr:hypothetical protein [Pseudomonadota bacterium]